MDRLVLQRILEPEVPRGDPRVRIIEAGGWSLADSTARSILAVQREPVALVVDADATSPELVEDRRRFLEESLGAVAASPKVFRVFLFVPELEVIFFQAGMLAQLRGHFKRDVPYPVPAEMKLEAKYAPKRALEKAGIGRAKLVHALDSIDLGPAKDAQNVKEIRKFVFDMIGAHPARRQQSRHR